MSRKRAEQPHEEELAGVEIITAKQRPETTVLSHENKKYFKTR
jgi:hypothetical protein